jgi:hypothetical protein
MPLPQRMTPTKLRRDHVTRAEFDRLKAEVRRVAELIESNLEIIRANQRNHEIQFQRIAQVQAELDAIKARSRKLGIHS